MIPLFSKIAKWPSWFKIIVFIYAGLVVSGLIVLSIWIAVADEKPEKTQTGVSQTQESETIQTSQATDAVTTSVESGTTSVTTKGFSNAATTKVSTSATSKPTTKATTQVNGNIKLYSAPSSMTSSVICKVEVNGKECFVYETNVNYRRLSPLGNARDVLQLEKAPVAIWDMEGKATVTVTLPDNIIDSATVKPLSSAIKTNIKGKTVTLVISKPGQYVVEFNNSTHDALHLFVNPLDKNPPTQSSSGLLYYGPGIHEVGAVYLQSNQNVYIAGGAVVRGWFVGSYVNNVKIYGSGIVDGSIYPRYKPDGYGSAAHPPIQFSKSSNIELDSITFLDPAGWTVNTYHCSNVKVNNVKIISSRQNGDGITTQSCTNQRVTNCFVRSWDDSLVVKAYEGNVRDISFDNCILWTDLAQSCEVGYETRGDVMENISFTNITVLHNFHKAVLSIHNGDRATVQNVVFKNIVVEDAQMGTGDGSDLLIDITIDDGIWSKENKRGQVRNVIYENIFVLGGKSAGSRIMGYDSNHTVEGVCIKNVMIKGQKINSLSKGKFATNQYISDIRFE